MATKVGAVAVTESYVIQNQSRLEGAVRLSAAKNSVLPLMAAALLCSGRVRLRGVPRLTDVQTSCELLQAVGASARREGPDILIDPAGVAETQLPARQAAAMRASVFYLAPLLMRLGQVTLPTPGGCRLGPRPVDIHLDGLTRMGARVRWQDDSITLQAPARLRAVDYTLRLPSVGATETLLMAAVTAQGVSVLRNVACEPEICDLADFLNRCGAHIGGAGSTVMVVRGVQGLSGGDWQPLPDRIVGSTLAAAVACAGGWVQLQNARPAQMAPMLSLLESMGCGVHRQDDRVTVERDGPLRGGQRLCTGSYPEFASDAAPLAAAALLYAEGESVVQDTMFERRFLCAEGFRALGAQVTGSGQRLTICGGRPLTGTDLYAHDLRGGAALVLAALGAKGQSRVHGAQHIARGYETLDRTLSELGARIERRAE